MKRILICLLLASLALTANAQQEIPPIIVEEPSVEEKPEEHIYTIAEEQPEYPGGHEKMAEFIAQNVKYPKQAKKKGVEGVVVVQFVVNKEGKLEDIKTVKDPGAGCGKEAVRVIKKMPAWKPGYIKGKPVKVKYYVPVKFVLGKETDKKK